MIALQKRRFDVLGAQGGKHDWEPILFSSYRSTKPV